MSEKAPKISQQKRMRRRAAYVLSRIRDRFRLLADPYLRIGDPAAGCAARAAFPRTPRAWLSFPRQERSAPAPLPNPQAGARRKSVPRSRRTRGPALEAPPGPQTTPATRPERVALTSPPEATCPQPARPDHGNDAERGVAMETLFDIPAAASGNPAATREVAGGISVDLRQIAGRVAQRRVLAIADSENDTEGVVNTLRFAGILGKRGNLRNKVRGASIVQTGDLLHKNAPDPAVVAFWNDLGSAAETAGCSLHLVAGNHELEIWRRLQSGERLGLRRREQRAVQGLIRDMVLFRAEGSMLFIHGYPTVKLLRHVQAHRLGTGRDLNDYNRDCFQPALRDPELLARYAYPRRQACRGCLLHDVPDPQRYYRRHGEEIAALLGSLGIDLVVHGHRPERSGTQIDHECARWLPGIRMISGDIQLRYQGLGGTLIRQDGNSPTDLRFINRADTSAAHRSRVRRMLRTPPGCGDLPAGRRGVGTGGRIFEMIFDDGWARPAAVGESRATIV